MRKLIFNLHLYTALVVGLFIVILGVTGSIIAFEAELDVLFNPSLFKVQPGPKPLPVSDVFGALKAAYPHQKFGSLYLPSAPDRSYNYTSYNKGAHNTQIFVNGYTGKIIGTRSLPTMLGNIHQLHMRLLMPPAIGKDITLIASFVLLWLVGSGIYLWWPLKRVKVKWGASLRRVAFDLHSTVGIFAALFLFVLALTGIFVHFDESLDIHLNKMAHVAEPARMLPSRVEPGVAPISPDEAIATAKAALPGTKPNVIFLPVGPKGAYRVNMYYPEDLTGNRSWVIIDQYSGKQLFVESSRTAVFGTKAIIENRAIHTGQIYGYPTKILMSLASLITVLMTITGYYMWWKKLKTVKTREPQSVAETLV
ncbi:MAG TPA: PepSY-associated TM helix domain-containing protein [Acidobacteriaceae bacterium]|nr:PepSY-associated TM helix domain-containing protein [Acidobacteriaceae bacterium]